MWYVTKHDYNLMPVVGQQILCIAKDICMVSIVVCITFSSSLPSQLTNHILPELGLDSSQILGSWFRFSCRPQPSLSRSLVCSGIGSQKRFAAICVCKVRGKNSLPSIPPSLPLQWYHILPHTHTHTHTHTHINQT